MTPAFAISDLFGDLPMRRAAVGLVLEGPVDAPAPYLDAVFADPVQREAFFTLVDTEGLVVARGLVIDPAQYRPVRGKRGHRRLSQGEHYHHDGCSTPTKPRVVEIRCPPQDVVRSMGTAAARFPQVVQVMLRQLPAALRRGSPLDALHARLLAGDISGVDWTWAQGLLNRVIRQLDADTARGWFQRVDAEAGAFCEPWTFGESRFVANTNAGQTVQHRRVCAVPWVAGTPNGHLLKRWPAEELTAPAVCAPCARADAACG
ncbi:MAG: hypothetical protein ACI8PZ_001174 [Myxococcota bacterium]|jgi:hypothetical protein